MLPQIYKIGRQLHLKRSWFRNWPGNRASYHVKVEDILHILCSLKFANSHPLVDEITGKHAIDSPYFQNLQWNWNIHQPNKVQFFNFQAWPTSQRREQREWPSNSLQFEPTTPSFSLCTVFGPERQFTSPLTHLGSNLVRLKILCPNELLNSKGFAGQKYYSKVEVDRIGEPLQCMMEYHRKDKKQRLVNLNWKVKRKREFYWRGLGIFRNTDGGDIEYMYKWR